MGSVSASARESSVVADASGLLQTLQGHVEDIRALLQCGICVRPLYEPYTLACGHTFCYGCLTSWFTSGRSHKTCPDCRAQVKIQPAPAYLVRTIVQLFTSHAELLEKDETTAEHSKNQREEAEKLEADKSNEDPNTGGLFQGFFKPKPHPAGPIFDTEDGVARCPNCAWELEEDSCMNCGYHVEDGTMSSMSDYSDDLSDMTDEDENDDDDDDNDDDDDENDEEEMGDADADAFADYDGAWVDEYPHAMPFSFREILNAAQQFAPHQHHHHHTHPYHPFLGPPVHRRPPYNFDGEPNSSITHTSESESEEDEDEDMDSFIDDDEPGIDDSEEGSHTDHSTVVGDHDYMGYDIGTDTSSIHESLESESAEDDDGDDDDDEDEDDQPIRSAPIRRTGQSSLFQNNHNRPIGRGRHPQPSFGLQRNSAAGTSASNAINVDDDSEDEMPISAAARRSRPNRR
ncbi:hypothetical protein UA08_00191 [Talaromyces atroroseus]|uniref:RING-type domain-containing protein n=1 Tax=Talaromyces atroroseus TaxID=1441469 RepID=A0A225AS69_TALAT|nr:hypothetical protein UA08_00191 [Talaromyces atroroseus]OKL64441.1 hypothetical protein UA08_00191 [Talaromyces atroroseus]